MRFEDKVPNLEKTLQQHCPKFSTNNMPWLLEHLKRSYEKNIEGFGHTGDKEQVSAFYRNLREAENCIRSMSITNKDFLQIEFDLIAKDFEHLTKAAAALNRRVNNKTTKSSHTKYPAAMMAGACMKIWNEENGKKTKTLNAQRDKGAINFIQKVFEILEIEGNPSSAFKRFNEISGEDGVSL